MNLIEPFLILLFLVGLFFLSASIGAMRRLHKHESKKTFKLIAPFFFYRSLFLKLFPKHEYEGILFSAIVTQNVLRIALLSSIFLFISRWEMQRWPLSAVLLLILFLLIALFIVSDYIPRIIGSNYPSRILSSSALIISPYLVVSLPLTYLFIRASEALRNNLYYDYLNEPLGDAKHEIYEILQEAEISPKLSSHDRKLIESVFHFQSRIAREIMVPRIDMFSLSSTLSIEQAAKLLQDQGYSRVPIYKETIDTIIGVLMYKDILAKYMEYREKGNDPKILETPIESIAKNVMYAPETKKISNLLQEFRKKQVHLAIIVDEYGGTEGIVTIEDILEEIVGDIEDEYDEEADLFVPLHEGSWMVDARMTILDAEEQFDIRIPQEGDYDTLGGFLFHRAGAIPSKGFAIKLDDVELEVMKSNDRRVEKLKIKKITPHPDT